MKNLELSDYGIEMDLNESIEINGGTGPGIPDGKGGYKAHPNFGSESITGHDIAEFFKGLFFGCDC